MRTLEVWRIVDGNKSILNSGSLETTYLTGHNKEWKYLLEENYARGQKVDESGQWSYHAFLTPISLHYSVWFPSMNISNEFLGESRHRLQTSLTGMPFSALSAFHCTLFLSSIPRYFLASLFVVVVVLISCNGISCSLVIPFYSNFICFFHFFPKFNSNFSVFVLFRLSSPSLSSTYLWVFEGVKGCWWAWRLFQSNPSVKFSLSTGFRLFSPTTRFGNRTASTERQTQRQDEGHTIIIITSFSATRLTNIYRYMEIFHYTLSSFQ